MSNANWLKFGLLIIFTFFSSLGSATSLPQVTGLSIEGDVLTWDTQSGADGYNIHLDYNYYDTVRDTQSYTLIESGIYHVVSFNDSGEFGVINNPDNDDEYSVTYEGVHPGAQLCTSAEDIGPLSLPYIREDSLGIDTTDNRVHFYRFEAEPGTMLVANLRGSASGAGDLDDPLMGLFDFDCQEIAINDDRFNTESYLRFAVPEEGVFVIAVTRYSDFQFDGTNQITVGSSYTLSVETAPQNIGSISARLINSLTGIPLTGEQTPFAFAELYRCDRDCDLYVDTQSANSNGMVRFTGENAGGLQPGTFLVRGWANDFESADSGRFIVNEASEIDIGDIPLSPPSIDLGNVVACDSIPSQGGVCAYEFQIYNNTNSPVSALVWSDVEGYGLSSPMGYTSFEASAAYTSTENVMRLQVDIPAYSSSAASFSFEIPSSVPEGAEFCQSAWLGLYPDPLFNTLSQEYLFCVNKDANGYERSTGAEMAKSSARYNELAINDKRRSMGIPRVD